MFHLGSSSERNLVGVHADLARTVRGGIEVSEQDFSVIEGLRNMERQKQLFAAKATRTLNSKHLVGRAVDLGAYIQGKISWAWPLYFDIARAMQKAARAQNVRITWGGVWDRCLNDLSDDLEHEVAEYIARRKKLGAKAFIDGPHFELEGAA